MSKTELINFVKHQVGVELLNDPNEMFNRKRNVLYTQITRNNYYNVASLLIKKGLRLEKHVGDYYWIFLK